MSYNFSSEYIDEIVLNTLRRLPVKSLSRFKCVSKLWNYAISHPNFLKTNFFLFFSASVYECPSLHSIDAQPLIHSHQLPWKEKKPWKDLEFRYERFLVTNSCNGLVLVGIDTNLFLFNPSTNYFVKVLELNSLGDDGYFVNAGFCYDHSINDYKAVLRLTHESPDYGGMFVIVASLRSKRWKEIPFRFHDGSVKPGPVVNGRLHWTVQDPHHDWFTGGKMIIHFDSWSNIFEELLMPKPKHNDVNAIVALGVLDGQLCMCRGGEMGEDNKFESVEVMVMKEYGVGESWTTLFVVSNVDLMVNGFYQQLTPLIFTKNGEVFFNISNRKLVLYNPITDSYTNVDMSGTLYSILSVSSDVSLVTPKGCKWSRRKHRGLGHKITRLRRNNSDFYG